MSTLSSPFGPLRFRRDAWGYPSFELHARDHVYWMRGYMHAVDRLIQVQLNLEAAHGRLMALLGDEPLARTVDFAVRALDFTSDTDAQVAKLDREAWQMVTLYCDGFNAGAARRGWPLELRALGIAPRELRLGDVLSLYRLLSYFGLSSQQQLVEVVTTELLARGIDTTGIEMMLGHRVEPLDDELRAQIKLAPGFRQLARRGQLGGSNAAVVSPSRSATGTGLMCSEFHLEIGQIPPFLYANAATFSDGNYELGLGVPGVPWNSAGRTRELAWTYTFAHGDNIDVVLERCERGRALAAERRWLELDRRVELAIVRGRSEPERWTFYDHREGRFGTVIGDARQPGIYPCVRWAGLREIHRDINMVVPLRRARRVDEALDLHREMQCLTLNALLVDDRGHIGHTLTGRVDDPAPFDHQRAAPYCGWLMPDRLPQPIEEDLRPRSIDPEAGILVSANEQVDRRWISLPEPSYRFDRLHEMFARRAHHSLDDLLEMSYDATDLCAARLMPIWAALSGNPELEPLRRWAAAKQPVHSASSRGKLALFYALHHEMCLELLSGYLGKAAVAQMFDELGLGYFIQSHLDEVLAGARPDLADASHLRRALGRAWPRAQARAARGEVHAPVRASFRNALTQGKLPSWTGMSSPSFDLPGGPSAPFQTRTLGFRGQRLVAGPVFHLYVDMHKPGAWYNIAGGASERRSGPGYGKGYGAWLRGELLPLGQTEGAAPTRKG